MQCSNLLRASFDSSCSASDVSILLKASVEALSKFLLSLSEASLNDFEATRLLKN